MVRSRKSPLGQHIDFVLCNPACAHFQPGDGPDGLKHGYTCVLPDWKWCVPLERGGRCPSFQLQEEAGFSHRDKPPEVA